MAADGLGLLQGLRRSLPGLCRRLRPRSDKTVPRLALESGSCRLIWGDVVGVGPEIRQKRAARRCRVCGQVPSRPTDLSMFNSRSVLARALLIASRAVRNWLVWAASVVTSPVATASWLAAITPSRTCRALAGARGSVRRSSPTRRIAPRFSAP